MVKRNLSDEYVKEIQMKNLDLLFKNSQPMIFDKQEAPLIRYSKRANARRIVDHGYITLPRIYQEVFLDSLKNLLVTQDYDTILQALDSGGGPWGDWLAAIHQRQKGYHREATHAFEECIADLYDGFLSMQERKGIKPPDHQTISPLVEWGRSEWGPYTWPATTGTKIGMKMSVVSMPPAYSKNIALWAALGHEAGGHDILHADKGLLNEIGNAVETEILKHENDPKLKKQKAIVNGREKPLTICAAAYWKYAIDETASDVCGVLNLGPSAGIGLANLLIPLRKMSLYNSCPSSSFHPIDALRILLAADVVRELPDLDVKIADAWSDLLENIVDKYIPMKKEFILYTQTSSDQVHGDDKMPYEGMRETVKIVADTIAFTPLESLDNHPLSEINTWANEDEIITMRITDDLIAEKEPSIKPQTYEGDIYAAHILAGAIIALAKAADISATTNLAIKALNKLHDNNPVWRGFPVRFRSDAHLHHMVPSYRKDIPLNPSF